MHADVDRQGAYATENYVKWPCDLEIRPVQVSSKD